MISGVIFDLDGTLLESTNIWNEIDIEYLGRYGYEVPDDYKEKIATLGFLDIAKYTIDRFNIDDSPENVVNTWNSMAQKAYEYDVKLKTGARELLDYIKKKNIPMAVATSNHSQLYEPCLKRNGIYEYFLAFTETKEVGAGKEKPDIYLKAAKKIGVNPKECVVFEDILAALETAKKAGFQTIGIWEEDRKQEKSKFIENSDFVVEDLRQAIEFFDK